MGEDEGAISPWSVRFKELERDERGTHRLIVHADVPTIVVAIPREGAPAFRSLRSSEGERDDLLWHVLERDGIGQAVLTLLRASDAGKEHEAEPG